MKQGYINIKMPFIHFILKEILMKKILCAPIPIQHPSHIILGKIYGCYSPLEKKKSLNLLRKSNKSVQDCAT